MTTTAGWDCGLAEWIIDDSCLVVVVCTQKLLFENHKHWAVVTKTLQITCNFNNYETEVSK